MGGNLNTQRKPAKDMQTVRGCFWAQPGLGLELTAFLLSADSIVTTRRLKIRLPISKLHPDHRQHRHFLTVCVTTPKKKPSVFNSVPWLMLTSIFHWYRTRKIFGALWKLIVLLEATLPPSGLPKQPVTASEAGCAIRQEQATINSSHLTVPALQQNTANHAVRLWHKKAGFVAGCGKKHPIESKKSTGRKLGVGWQWVAMGVWWWRVGVRKECSLHSLSPSCYHAYAHIITPLSHWELWRECSITVCLRAQRLDSDTLTDEWSFDIKT